MHPFSQEADITRLSTRKTRFGDNLYILIFRVKIGVKMGVAALPIAGAKGLGGLLVRA